MNYNIPKLTSLLKCHGGKAYLARRFVTLFPETPIYVEACAGGLNVLLARAKLPGVREIACEIDPSIYLVWKAAIQEPRQLIDCIKKFSYNEQNFVYSQLYLNANDPKPNWIKGDLVTYAANYIICNRMSRGGLMTDFAWSERLRGKRAPTGPIPGDVSAWNEFQRVGIERTVERVKDVELIYGDCLRDCLIPLFKNEKKKKSILVYLDPPYPAETRTHTGTYKHEMNTFIHEVNDESKETTHEDIILFMQKHEKNQYFFCSSYHSKSYDWWLNTWDCVEFNMPNHSGQGETKQRRIECLYTNRELVR